MVADLSAQPKCGICDKPVDLNNCVECSVSVINCGQKAGMTIITYHQECWFVQKTEEIAKDEK